MSALMLLLVVMESAMYVVLCGLLLAHPLYLLFDGCCVLRFPRGIFFFLLI